MMLGMPRRNLLLWFSFAAIPLAPLVLVLVGALKQVPTEASRQIKKIQLGMTIDQVRAAIGTEVIGTETSTPPSGVGGSLGSAWGLTVSSRVTPRWGEWYFRDYSAISV